MALGCACAFVLHPSHMSMAPQYLPWASARPSTMSGGDTATAIGCVSAAGELVALTLLWCRYRRVVWRRRRASAQCPTRPSEAICGRVLSLSPSRSDACPRDSLALHDVCACLFHRRLRRRVHGYRHLSFAPPHLCCAFRRDCCSHRPVLMLRACSFLVCFTETAAHTACLASPRLTFFLLRRCHWRS